MNQHLLSNSGVTVPSTELPNDAHNRSLSSFVDRETGTQLGELRPHRSQPRRSQRQTEGRGAVWHPHLPLRLVSSRSPASPALPPSHLALPHPWEALTASPRSSWLRLPQGTCPSPRCPSCSGDASCVPSLGLDARATGNRGRPCPPCPQLPAAALSRAGAVQSPGTMDLEKPSPSLAGG